MKTQLIFTLVIALVTIGATYRQGVMSDRWDNAVSDRLNQFSAVLDNVFEDGKFVPASAPAIPRSVGNWVATDVLVDEGQFKASHCHGVVSRLYKNAVSGEEVSVFLVSGKGYHVTIHSPDWCYVAAGYEMEASPSPYQFEATGIPKPEVLNALFEKLTNTETTRLRILWTYSDDGQWNSPKLAKHQFASKPALYKIYFIASANGPVPKLGEDPSVKFAKEFLPAINPILFSDAEKPGSVELPEG